MDATTQQADVQSVDHEKEMRLIDRVADGLDAKFSLFGIPFGYDAILGLIPGLGDTVTFAPAAWMVWKAHKMGAEKHVLGRMALNTGIDWLVGMAPLLGDLFDVGFRANRRNARLLRRHLEERGHLAPKSATR